MPCKAHAAILVVLRGFATQQDVEIAAKTRSVELVEQYNNAGK